MRNSIVFIDWDGTLCHARFWQQLRGTDTKTHEKIQQLLFTKDNPIFREWMLGQRTSESVCAWLAPQLGIPEPMLWDGLLESLSFKKLPDGFTNALEDIKKRAYVVLVTDNADIFVRFVAKNLRLDEVFDHVLNSSDTMRMKRDEDGRTFVDFAKEKDIPMSKTYFIDDSEVNCTVFESTGGRAYRTSGIEQTFAHLQKIEEDLSTRQ